ncbi:hypothetical protein Emed_006990 [Eimeria media]
MTKGWKDPLLLSAAAGLLVASVPEAFGAQLRLSPQGRHLQLIQRLPFDSALETPPAAGFLQVATSKKGGRGGKKGRSSSPSLWNPERPRLTMIFGRGNPLAEPLKTSDTESSGEESEGEGGATGGGTENIPVERGGTGQTPLRLAPATIPSQRPVPPLPWQQTPTPPGTPATPLYETIGSPKGGASGTGAAGGPGEEDPYSLPFDAIPPSSPGGGGGGPTGPGTPEEDIYASPWDIKKPSGTGEGAASSSGGAEGAAGPQGPEPIYARPMKKNRGAPKGGKGGNEGVFQFPDVRKELDASGGRRGSPSPPRSPGSPKGALARGSWGQSTMRRKQGEDRGRGGRGRRVGRNRFGTETRDDILEEGSSEDDSPPPFKPPPPPKKEQTETSEES